jgi:hypothetical protein
MSVEPNVEFSQKKYKKRTITSHTLPSQLLTNRQNNAFAKKTGWNRSIAGNKPPCTQYDTRATSGSFWNTNRNRFGQEGKTVDEARYIPSRPRGTSS